MQYEERVKFHQDSARQKTIPVLVVPPSSHPKELKTKTADLDEDKLRQNLKNLKRTNSSIKTLVLLCLETKESYKVVRSWQRVILSKDIDNDMKQTLWYFLNELSIESSKKKMEDLSERLSKSIIEVLPVIENCVPQSKIRKCLSIWKLYGVYKKKTIVEMEKMLRVDDVPKLSEDKRVIIDDVPKKVEDKRVSIDDVPKKVEDKSSVNEKTLDKSVPIDSTPSSESQLLGFVCPMCRVIFSDLSLLKSHLEHCMSSEVPSHRSEHRDSLHMRESF